MDSVGCVCVAARLTSRRGVSAARRRASGSCGNPSASGCPTPCSLATLPVRLVTYRPCAHLTSPMSAVPDLRLEPMSRPCLRIDARLFPRALTASGCRAVPGTFSQRRLRTRALETSICTRAGSGIQARPGMSTVSLHRQLGADDARPSDLLALMASDGPSKVRFWRPSRLVPTTVN